MHPNRHIRSQQRRTLRQIRKTDAYAFFDLLKNEEGQRHYSLEQTPSRYPLSTICSLHRDILQGEQKVSGTNGTDLSIKGVHEVVVLRARGGGVWSIAERVSVFV
jgi:hypothetical protein